MNPTSIRYSFHVVDFTSRMPPKHVEARACRSNDIACEAPVDVPTYDDQSGNLQFNLPSEFLGYFEIKSEFLPTLLYVTKPLLLSSDNRDLPLVSTTVYEGTLALAGVSMIPETGLVLLDAIDCDNAPAGGIEFKVQDVEASRFYLVNMLPDANAEVTVYDPINNTADAVFANVAPNFVTFTAHLGDDGLQLQSFNAMVRAGWVTFIDMTF